MNKSRLGRTGGGRVRPILELRKNKSGASQSSGSRNRQSQSQNKNRQSNNRQKSNRQEQNQQTTYQNQVPFWDPWDYPPQDASGVAVPDFPDGGGDRPPDGSIPLDRDPFDDW